MSKKLLLYRWRKKIILLAAALPIFQATGTCDLIGVDNFFLGQFGQNLTYGIFGSVVRGVQSTLLNFYPSADALQTFLGGNPTPFYTG